jgi:hypothetical protein
MRDLSGPLMTLTESRIMSSQFGDAVTRCLIEIESLADFDAHISETADSTDGSCSQSI